jgi:hypothetical protein
MPVIEGLRSVITGVARSRRFSTDLKLAVVAETMQFRRPLEPVPAHPGHAQLPLLKKSTENLAQNLGKGSAPTHSLRSRCQAPQKSLTLA